MNILTTTLATLFLQVHDGRAVESAYPNLAVFSAQVLLLLLPSTLRGTVK